MKKILRKLSIVNIDVFIFNMEDYVPLDMPDFKYIIQKENTDHRIRYFIDGRNETIHESFVFPKVYLLKLLGKNGPVIGDCQTHSDYRGQSIYPYVINHIAKDILQDVKEILVVVNQSNLSSIKGLEKGMFNKIASIKAKRFLWFYLNKEVILYNPKKKGI